MHSSTTSKLKRLIGRMPILGPFTYRIYQKLFRPFRGSERYWQDRYSAGGNSGAGSYDALAEFKAEVINGFVLENKVSSVIEYGCGDGNQLALAKYPSYLGFDVSPRAISICQNLFADDRTKAFHLLDEYNNQSADLTLSLDVIYHLIEDNVFNRHMERLFDSSRKFVIIYASNTDENPKDKDAPAHVKHRNFSNWIRKNRAEWTLLEFIANKYPFDARTGKGSFADFHIYAKAVNLQPDPGP